MGRELSDVKLKGSIEPKEFLVDLKSLDPSFAF
jgi:hypothetical protein